MRFLRPRSRELPGESRACWSIGYQQTPKILEWVPSDVKLCLPEHVSSDAISLADPFLIRVGGNTLLFCKVL